MDDEGNQRETYLNAGYQPFKNSSGEVRGVLIIFIDVTDQVKSLMARDNFISIASHELKTPLTTLKLQTQMIKRSLNKSSETQPPQIMSFFDKTEVQLDRLDRLVNDMLEGSRKSEEKLEMHFVRVDFSSFVREIFQNYDPQFKNVGIDLVLDIQEGISAQIDEARLEQVLVNLITNMIRYAPHAPAKVMMTTDSQNIRLEVIDGGPGVDLEDQEIIFDRFGRGSSQKDTTGLGLGLYISRKIVEAHLGTIKVQSKKGQGATFVITLPT